MAQQVSNKKDVSVKVQTTIRVTKSVTRRLRKIGRMGDSYSTVIERLLDDYEEDLITLDDEDYF